jgi:Holliday junction resolvase RusA-like endonuclease
VWGKPVAWVRPLVTKNHGVWDRKAKERKELKEVLAKQLAGTELSTENMIVTMRFFFNPSKEELKKAAMSEMSTRAYVKKPDVDNLAKIYLDALTGLLWHDDAQVNSLAVWKGYGEEERVEISVSYWSYGH